jgi:hypothetical protein
MGDLLKLIWYAVAGLFRRSLANRSSRLATRSRALERLSQLHPPRRALFLVPAEKNTLNRDDVVGQAFVGNPVSDLLVAYPNVAGES